MLCSMCIITTSDVTSKCVLTVNLVVGHLLQLICFSLQVFVHNYDPPWYDNVGLCNAFFFFFFLMGRFVYTKICPVVLIVKCSVLRVWVVFLPFSLLSLKTVPFLFLHLTLTRFSRAPPSFLASCMSVCSWLRLCVFVCACLGVMGCVLVSFFSFERKKRIPSCMMSWLMGCCAFTPLLGVSIGESPPTLLLLSCLSSWVPLSRCTERPISVVLVGIAALHSPLLYHWRELPQVSFLLWQTFCCYKHIFCRNKSMLDMTKVLLRKMSRQNIFVATELWSRQKKLWQAYFCHNKRETHLLSQQKYACLDKHTFGATKDVFCLNKHVTFVATCLFCHGKNYTCGSSRQWPFAALFC